MLKQFTIPKLTLAQQAKQRILAMCGYVGGKPMPVLRPLECGDRLRIEHAALGQVKATFITGEAARRWYECDSILLLGGTDTCLDSEGWAVEERFMVDADAVASVFLSHLQQQGDLRKAIEACESYLGLFSEE